MVLKKVSRQGEEQGQGGGERLSSPTGRRAGVHPPFAPTKLQRDDARRADPAQSRQRTRCGVSPFSRAPCPVGAYPSYA